LKVYAYLGQEIKKGILLRKKKKNTGLKTKYADEMVSIKGLKVAWMILNFFSHINFRWPLVFCAFFLFSKINVPPAQYPFWLVKMSDQRQSFAFGVRLV